MHFQFPKPHRGNEKPIMQHVQGGVLTEWRVSDDRNHVVKEQRPLPTPATGPRAGTFFLGGMETTVDELADYIAEANERNASPKPDRLPTIQKKIDEQRSRHADAIRAGVRWKRAGYQLPKRTPAEQRMLYLPKAVAVEGPNGKLQIVEVIRGR